MAILKTIKAWLDRMRRRHFLAAGRTLVPVTPPPPPPPPPPPSITLAALGLSPNSINENSPPGTVIGSIINATPGSTVTLFADDGGRAAKSGNNIVAGATNIDFESGGGSRSFTLRETLAGASNSPRDTTINYTVLDIAEGGPAAPVEPPQLSGVPRDGEAAWIYAGEWSDSPTTYRFTRYRDGVMVGSPTVQAAPGYEFTWVTADVGTVPSFTVEASTDSGATWSAPATAELDFVFLSSVITPAAIPAGTATRTSASGVLPMTFDVNADVYDSYIWEFIIRNSGGTQLYHGFKNVSPGELQSPFNIDLTGATDPAPQPPMPVLGATDVLSLRLVSGDWMDGGGTASAQRGVAQNFMAVSPTDTAGFRYWKLNFTASSSANIVLREIEAATSIGGANVAGGKSYTYFVDAGGSFAASHFFDGIIVSNQGGLNNGGSMPLYVIIDFGVPADLHQLRLYSHTDYMPSVPTSFTFASSSDGITFNSPVISPSGLSWTADEIKTWTF